MNIIFKYDTDKDVENFTKSTKSVNSKEPTKLFLLFSGELNNPTMVNEVDVKNFIGSYIQKNNINTQNKTDELQKRWEGMEVEFVIRLEKYLKENTPLLERDQSIDWICVSLL